MKATVEGDAFRFITPWRVVGWGCGMALLAVPALAGWDWNAAGFIIFGMTFAVLGGLIELAAHKAGSAAHGWASAIAVLTGFVLLWVGRIGSEDGHLQNFIYFVEIAVAFAGAVGARFRPMGLAWAMFLTALFQLVVTLAIVSGWGAQPGTSAFGSLAFNVAVGALWALAGVLFRTEAQPLPAGRRQSPAHPSPTSSIQS
jgi:hypothetical protein